MGEDRDPDLEKLKRAAREAMEGGVDVREEVRAATTEALSAGTLDRERIAHVVRAVTQGVDTGAGDDAERAREHVREAMSGVDEALAKAAQAIQLTAEEARARWDGFSEEDLSRVRDDLRTLEAVFVDAMRELASRGDELLRGIWSDLERHARSSGTEVGRQAGRSFSDAGDELRNAWQAQARATRDAALATGVQIAQVASGFLAGIADSLSAAQGPRPPPGKGETHEHDPGGPE